MYLSLPFQNHEARQFFKDSVELAKEPSHSIIFGISNKIFGNKWALEADQIGHARVFNYPLK